MSHGFKSLVVLLNVVFFNVATMSVQAEPELIVLASPSFEDDYYADVESGIFDFHVAFAQKIIEHDRLLVLTDSVKAPHYIRALGKKHVLIAPMLDIWMRDFTLSNTRSPIMFRYTATAQDDQMAADDVQEEFYSFAKRAGLAFEESDLLNDGGNFVDDFSGNVVISTKFLSDNRFTEEQARTLLTRHNSINHVAFIEADEQGGLEHADGVVSFIDSNTLIINTYPDDPDYSRELKEDLKRGLPGVKIFEIPTPYDDSKIHDDRFGSACGLYTNALVTPQRIYLPQFGIPEDEHVLEFVESLTTKQVIPVNSQQVCFMGGGVRCMSWQLRGENAKRLIHWLPKGT